MMSIQLKVNCGHGIHARPASLLVKLAGRFPNTELNLIKAKEREEISLKSIMGLMQAAIKDEETVEVVAEGEMESLAIEVFRIALENLRCPGVTSSNYIPAIVEKVICDKIDAYCATLDPHQFEQMLTSNSTVLSARDEEHIEVAKTNDKFHSYTAPAFPLVARHFACKAELRFAIANCGIRTVRLDPDNVENSIDAVLLVNPAPGTDITVATTGSNRVAAGKIMRLMLNHLRECDDWLRNRPSGVDEESSITGLIAFAQGIGEFRGKPSDPLLKFRISDILSENRICIFWDRVPITKQEALRQLVYPHAIGTNISPSALIAAVAEPEADFPIMLDTGIAVSHITLRQGPRVSLSVGVFPAQVKWTSEQRANLVFCFVTARDTHGTYRMYLGQLAKVLRGDVLIRSRLFRANTARDVLCAFFAAEQGT